MARSVDHDSFDQPLNPHTDGLGDETAAPESDTQEVDSVLEEVAELSLDEVEENSASAETVEVEADGAGTDGATAGVLLSGAHFSEGIDSSFIDEKSLTEQASSSLALNGFSLNTFGELGSNSGSFLAPIVSSTETNIEFTSSYDTELTTNTFIAANQAPITNAAASSGAEDAASIAVTLTGGDFDGTIASYALSNLPANGTLYTDIGLTTVAATGVN